MSLLAVAGSVARRGGDYRRGASIEAGRHALKSSSIHAVFFLLRGEGGNVDRQSRVWLAGVLPFLDCYIYIIAQGKRVVKNFFYQ